MAIAPASTIAELLLLRSSVLFLEPASEAHNEAPGEAAAALAVRGFELELANLGYVASARLRARALVAAPAELAKLRDLAIAANQKASGGTRKLEPMFRRFPDGIPTDTTALWWDRVIVHYLQRPQQPCVLCRQAGTIHVLNPCQHLVCDRCFDGGNYAGCPICNRAVDRDSPFFRPTPPRRGTPPAAARTFTLLDLGNPTAEQTMETVSAALFGSLCLRTQVMSPVDVDALLALISAYPKEVLGWLPAKIPVRENIALIFGTLLRSALAARASRSPRPTLRSKLSALVGRPRADAALTDSVGPTVSELLQVADPYLTTATDVLRLICALSGVSVALLPEAKVVTTGAKTAKRFTGAPRQHRAVVIAHHRFKVAKLPRTLRRQLLAILDRVAPAQLLEDLERHGARWVWVAEFLHPGEYATRFPNVARAFAQLRNGSAGGADGGAALVTWPSSMERAIARDATGQALLLLAQRPGEFLRRFDLLLRRAAQPAAVVEAFFAVIERTASPALVSLRAHLAARAQPLQARVYWPKAKFCVPVPPTDQRPSLPAELINDVCPRIDAELLRRFAAKPAPSTRCFASSSCRRCPPPIC
jgi:hypothetical protein